MRPKSHSSLISSPHYRRDDLAAVLEQFHSLVVGRIERTAVFALVCVFWGIILYALVSLSF